MSVTEEDGSVSRNLAIGLGLAAVAAVTPGSVRADVKYLYDPNGRLVTAYYTNGDQQGAIHYDYDPAGNLVLEIRYPPSLPGKDFDEDLFPDLYELEHFGVLDHGPGDDPDEDGLSNEQEKDLDTLPENPDTDGDGWTDGQEVGAGTNPKDKNDHPSPGDLMPLVFPTSWPGETVSISCYDITAGVWYVGDQVGDRYAPSSIELAPAPGHWYWMGVTRKSTGEYLYNGWFIRFE